jgi:Na+(H+)/acetate symporter ActP
VRLASYAVAATVLVAGTVLAALRPGSIIEIATWAAAVAAAGLFPAVMAALWMPRANSIAVAAGMIAGIGVLAGYLIAQHYFPVPFFEATAALSRGGASGHEYFNELKEAWLDAEPGVAKEEAWAALSVQARSVADWWGIHGPATVLLALPAGFVALTVFSLLSSILPSGRRAAKTAP